MNANHTEKKIRQSESFFDYWHYSEIDTLTPFAPVKTGEKIAEKIKAKMVCEELPDHCFQLLFLS